MFIPSCRRHRVVIARLRRGAWVHTILINNFVTNTPSIYTSSQSSSYQTYVLNYYRIIYAAPLGEPGEAMYVYMYTLQIGDILHGTLQLYFD